MPIEIRELIITAQVGSAEPSKKQHAPERDEPNQDKKLQGEAHEDIIAECVEKVMELIRKKTER